MLLEAACDDPEYTFVAVLKLNYDDFGKYRKGIHDLNGFFLLLSRHFLAFFV